MFYFVRIARHILGNLLLEGENKVKTREGTSTWPLYRWLLKHPLAAMLFLIGLVLIIGALGFELAGAWRMPSFGWLHGSWS